MKTNQIAFVLAMIAGLLCLGFFGYKYYQTGKVDATILLVGALILGLGFRMRGQKPEA